MINQLNKRSAGFTLLEILIALLIVSIGLLGVATLQIRGQQFNQVSYLRTQATLLGYDLMDRIRTNYAINSENSNMATYNVPTFVNVGPSGIIGQPITTCDTGQCNSTALMNYDLDNWFYYLRDTLPKGETKIVPKSQNSNGVTNKYEISIRWKDILDDGEEGYEELPLWKLEL